MSDKARKKERQRLKRKEKQLQRRRTMGISPYQLFARSARIVRCVMNQDWQERGQAVPFVLLEGPGGRLGMATFMIDLWCAGLKDA